MADGTSAATLPYIVAPAVLEVTGTSGGYDDGVDWIYDVFLPLIVAPTTASVTGTSAKTLPSVLATPVGYNYSAATLPSIVAAGVAGEQPAVQLPYIVASGTGLVGVVNASFPANDTLPYIRASGTGISGLFGSSSEVVPSIVAVGGGPIQSAGTLPLITAAGTGYAGVLATSARSLPYVVASGTAVAASRGSSAESLLLPTAASTGYAGALGRSSVTLPGAQASSAGNSGITGTALLTLPFITASGSGGINAVGTSINVALPYTQAAGSGYTASSGTYTVVAMHTELQALSTYSGFEINSMAKFNGVYLGAGDAGLFLLSGATDNGTAISARVRTGVTDFNTLHLKRVERLYVGYRSVGNMIMRMTTDGTNVRDYALKPTGKTGLHGNFVRLGRGVEAQYFQFEWLNVAGADFSLNMMELKPTVLKRRISGNHA